MSAGSRRKADAPDTAATRRLPPGCACCSASTARRTRTTRRRSVAARHHDAARLAFARARAGRARVDRAGAARAARPWPRRRGRCGRGRDRPGARGGGGRALGRRAGRARSGRHRARHRAGRRAAAEVSAGAAAAAVPPRRVGRPRSATRRCTRSNSSSTVVAPGDRGGRARGGAQLAQVAKFAAALVENGLPTVLWKAMIRRRHRDSTLGAATDTLARVRHGQGRGREDARDCRARRALPRAHAERARNPRDALASYIHVFRSRPRAPR